MFTHASVILSEANGSRAGTLPGHFARCFTLFSMTRVVLDNCYIITIKKVHKSVGGGGAVWIIVQMLMG